MKESKLSKFLSVTTDKLFGAKFDYRLRYFHQRKHFPNLTDPKDMSEILISDMFNPEKCREYSKYVDKVGVREYIKSKGLDNILLKHYGVWSQPEDIPFDELPNSFVLKSNNGCGHHVICRDKTKLNYQKAINTLHEAIKNGITNIEPHYHYIEPKVYAEELIETADGDLPVDYKFTCIGGEVVDIFVAVERAVNAKYCTLDTDWNLLPYTKKEYLPTQLPPKPNNLQELMGVAKILSKDFGFVRVDLYEYKGQPFFSELTFFPWGALLYSYTDEAIKIYGKKWHERMIKK